MFRSPRGVSRLAGVLTSLGLTSPDFVNAFTTQYATAENLLQQYVVDYIEAVFEFLDPSLTQEQSQHIRISCLKLLDLVLSTCTQPRSQTTARMTACAQRGMDACRVFFVGQEHPLKTTDITVYSAGLRQILMAEGVAVSMTLDVEVDCPEIEMDVPLSRNISERKVGEDGEDGEDGTEPDDDTWQQLLLWEEGIHSLHSTEWESAPYPCQELWQVCFSDTSAADASCPADLQAFLTLQIYRLPDGEWNTDILSKALRLRGLGRFLFSPLLRCIETWFQAEAEVGTRLSAQLIQLQQMIKAMKWEVSQIDSSLTPEIAVEANLLLKELEVGHREFEMKAWSQHVLEPGENLHVGSVDLASDDDEDDYDE
eukprot:2317947-Rhodomonas_salina.1